jgi:hypothetical protein
MNDTRFATFYNDKIRIGKIRHLAKSFSNPNSTVLRLGKCFKNNDDISINNTSAVFTLCEDNSAIVQNATGKQLSTIYPPPTAKTVVNVSYCMSLGKVFILLASGTICIYNIEKETAILEKL